MAITFSVPATTDSDTIVARLTSDERLTGIGNNDFSLRRADTGAQITATISNRLLGNFFWDITVQNTSSYRGPAYVQIRSRAFIEVSTIRRIPSSPLNSNTFTYVQPAPENFTASDGVNTAVLRWDVVSGSVYELRVDSGLWQDVISPHTVRGLSPDTEYAYELRVKGEGNGIATARKRTLVYPIEDIDEQFIPVGTQNYELIIGITGQYATSRIRGLQEGFYQHYEKLSDGNSQLSVKSEEVTRLIEKVIWSIEVGDTDWKVIKDVIYNVVPVSPILVDPGRKTLWKGVRFRLLVETLNIPTIQRGESELVGLKFGSVEVDGRSYIESAGRLPVDADLMFTTFNSDYYVENLGGNDTLAVPIDIRDDAVEPVFAGLSNMSVVAGSGFNLTFTVTSTPSDIVVALKEDAPNWVSLEHVSGNSYRLLGNPSAGTYMVTVVAYGLNEPEQTITVTVTAPVRRVAPRISVLYDTYSVAVGYSSAVTGRAYLSRGTEPVTWSISGISGATISQNGSFSIPTGLLEGRHRATITALNSEGSDTQRITVEVITPRAPSGTITLTAEVNRFGEVVLSWNAPSDRGFPSSYFRLFRRQGTTERFRIPWGSPSRYSVHTTYTDRSELTSGSIYQYFMRYWNETGFIDSNRVQVTIP